DTPHAIDRAARLHHPSPDPSGDRTPSAAPPRDSLSRSPERTPELSPAPRSAAPLPPPSLSVAEVRRRGAPSVSVHVAALPPHSTHLEPCGGCPARCFVAMPSPGDSGSGRQRVRHIHPPIRARLRERNPHRPQTEGHA